MYRGENSKYTRFPVMPSPTEQNQFTKKNCIMWFSFYSYLSIPVVSNYGFLFKKKLYFIRFNGMPNLDFHQIFVVVGIDIMHFHGLCNQKSFYLMKIRYHVQSQPTI